MKQPKRFMVVDDNHTNNLICQFAIRKYKHEADVSLFIEPEVALQIIRKEYRLGEMDTFIVLFLDINMPSMTGWEFLDEFRKFEEEIRRRFVIYILSSSVDERDKQKADADPLVAGFLSKPLTVNTVQQAVEGIQN